MSTQALRGTHRRFKSRTPRRVAAGNRWLQRARQVIQRDTNTPNTTEAGRVKESPEILGGFSKAATDDKPTVIVEQPVNPLIQQVDDMECSHSGSDDPMIGLNRVAEQLHAVVEVLESTQKVRKLSDEEALSLRVCNSGVRRLCALAQGISMYFPSDDGFDDEEWTE